MPEMPDTPEIETFIWKGQTRYRCPLNWESGAPCSFDTHEMLALVDHMRGPHTREAHLQPKPVSTRPPFTPAPTAGTGPDFVDVQYAPEQNMKE